MRYGNPQPEAPTVSRHQLPLPPEWLPADELAADELALGDLPEDDGPTRAAPGRGVPARAGWTPAPNGERSISAPSISGLTRPHVRTERSASPRTERSASPLLVERPHPDDVRREPRRRTSSPAVDGHGNPARSRVAVAPTVTAPASDDERRSFAAAGELQTSARLRETGESGVARRSSSSRSARDGERDGARHADRDGARDGERDGARHADPQRPSSRPDRRVVTEPASASAAPSASASGRSASSASSARRSARRGDGRDGGDVADRSDAGDGSSRPSARGSDPNIDVAAMQAEAAAAMAAMGGAIGGGMGAIDPLAVPVPPELGGPIYGWIRRLALQADLQGADKVLREAFVDLTSSLSVAIVYPGPDGLFTLGNDDEVPRDATPLVAVAQARRAMLASHTALIPVVTSTETVAVVILTRNPRNPAYHPVEQIAMVALARECAAILHHLAVAHLQKASEIKADQGGLYRGEALEAHRSRGNEGVPVNLSPSWVKRTYPILVVTILIALFASIFITVPTYSSGDGSVVLPGTAITAPSPGTVEQVLVQPGQKVKKGALLVRLTSAEQEAELRAAQTDADNLTYAYLFDQQDETTKKSLGSALNRVQREIDRMESRVIRAKRDGTVSDIRVRFGSALNGGDQVLQIVDPDAEPEVWAFLPAKDRPRLRPGQELQVEIVGYTKSRDKAKITYVSPEGLGPNEIATKIVGAQLADTIKLPPGSYVWVRAKLPGKKFKTQHNAWWYHHGMPVKAEVKIQSKPFLVTLLPALEKYIPD